jgi:hypothetical protein
MDIYLFVLSRNIDMHVYESHIVPLHKNKERNFKMCNDLEHTFKKIILLIKLIKLPCIHEKFIKMIQHDGISR